MRIKYWIGDKVFGAYIESVRVMKEIADKSDRFVYIGMGYIDE